MPATTAPIARRLLFVLTAVMLALLVPAAGASAKRAGAKRAGAERVSFKAKRLSHGRAVFRVRGVRSSQVRRAKISVGRYHKRIRKSQMRRAARRNKLRVRLPRRIVRRLRRGRTSGAPRRPKLTVVVQSPAAESPAAQSPAAQSPAAQSPAAESPAAQSPVVRPTGPVNGSVMSFETGDLSEASNFSTEVGSLDIIGSRGYDGSHSARASYQGGGLPGFQRVWKDVNWNAGSDVWYGMALYVPRTSDYCYWNPLRWDNYKTYQGSGDVGGLSIEGGRVHLIQSTYGGEERVLVDGGAMPQDRWVWLELHQRFSKNDGEALSELYMDGRNMGSSTKANSTGRVINHLRAGVVNVTGKCSKPGSVDFDRVSISDGMRGPLS